MGRRIVSGPEVGQGYVTVLPSTKGFHKALADEVSAASTKAGTQGGIAAGKGFTSGFGTAATSIGVALGGMFAVSKVAAAIGQTITAASNLNESQSKVAVVFGASAKAVNDWASTSATALLMSKQAALEAAGTYGNLFQAFGIGQQKSMEMSKTLVQLAADLASFNNTSTDDALLALRSGLSGETEPLKRFGVALTDQRLKVEALNQGIYGGKGIMTAAQKAQASYALILKDTTLAQGDAKRTADGFANTTKAVSAAIEDAKAKIGEGFVTGVLAASKAMGGPTGIVAYIERVAAGISDIAAGAGAAVTGLAAVGQGGKPGPSADTLARKNMDWFGTGSFLDNPSNIIGGPFVAASNALEVLGHNSTRAQLITEDLTAEFQRAAYMQDVYSGKVKGTSAYVSDMTPILETAAKKAQAYTDWQRQMGDAAIIAARGIDTLRAAQERMNGSASLRDSSLAIRGAWAGLDTAGPSKTVKYKVRNPDWKPGSKAQQYLTKTKTVPSALDPDVAGGRFANTESGRQGEQVASDIAKLYKERASILSDQGKYQAAENVYNRGQERLSQQFGAWGIRKPTAYAASFLSEPMWLKATIDMNKAPSPSSATDESRKMGPGTVYQFNFTGDIKAQTPQEAARWAKQLADLKAMSHGQIPAEAS
jgi:hypothetical protein